MLSSPTHRSPCRARTICGIQMNIRLIQPVAGNENEEDRLMSLIPYDLTLIADTLHLTILGFRGKISRMTPLTTLDFSSARHLLQFISSKREVVNTLLFILLPSSSYETKDYHESQVCADSCSISEPRKYLLHLLCYSVLARFMRAQ